MFENNPVMRMKKTNNKSEQKNRKIKRTSQKEREAKRKEIKQKSRMLKKQGVSVTNDVLECIWDMPIPKSKTFSNRSKS